MLAAVGRSIPLDEIRLPDEFYRAHLPVAIVDVVFLFGLRHGERPAPVAARYCRRFRISPTRTDLLEMPGRAKQETLEDMIGHFDELGVDGMANEVFRTRCYFPGTTILRAEYALLVAQALRHIGVDVLQDVHARRPRKVGEALRSLPGNDEHFERMLLACTADDDYVRGDVNVQRFVAWATDRPLVSSRHAANLVRQCAYELIISPRYLDHQIWRYGVAFMPRAVGRDR